MGLSRQGEEGLIVVPTDPLREGSRGSSISERSDSWVWGLELCLQHYPRRAQINQGLGGPGPSSVFRCLCWSDSDRISEVAELVEQRSRAAGA